MQALQTCWPAAAHGRAAAAAACWPPPLRPSALQGYGHSRAGTHMPAVGPVLRAHPQAVSRASSLPSSAVANWRTVIEGSSAGSEPDTEANDSHDCAASSSTVGGAITPAELRIKLALAEGSGRLDLTDCRLQRLPPEVLQLTNLEELSLSGNCLADLDEGISRLTALKRLGLAGNCLTSLPASLGSLTMLEGLWLHGNRITDLPADLGRLGQLKALSLAGNCLSSLPHGLLGGLTSLVDLTLAGNQLAAVADDLAACTALRKLALNGNSLATLPPGLSALSCMTELMVQGNQLQSLGDTLECQALVELSAADNSLASLPASMSRATSLARLYLYGNQLQDVPVAQLASLPRLSALWLEGNPLAGGTVKALLQAAGTGSIAHIKALGLDQAQLAAAGPEAVTAPLPKSVRVGSVLGSGPGYFKLQYGPGAGSSNVDPDSSRASSLLVVAFGSAPGTPNWGGVLGKVYKAAESDAERAFDVLYVVDPFRSWYGGGGGSANDAGPSASSRPDYQYYRVRLEQYTRPYKRVLMLGDSMGATASLLFSDLASAALAFCPQVDLAEASIRPGQPEQWLGLMRERLMTAVRRSRGRLTALVGTWAHDLNQANLLPPAPLALPASASSSSSSQAATPPTYRAAWSWHEARDNASNTSASQTSTTGGAAGEPPDHVGGVIVRVFSVDSHRLAAALEGRGQLVPLVRDAIMHELGLRSGNVRISNVL